MSEQGQITADVADVGEWYLSEHGRAVKVLEKVADGRARIYIHDVRTATIVPARYILTGPIEPPVGAEDGFQFPAPTSSPVASVAPDAAVAAPAAPVEPAAVAAPEVAAVDAELPETVCAAPELGQFAISGRDGLKQAIEWLLQNRPGLTRTGVYDLLAQHVQPEGRDLLQNRISLVVSSLIGLGAVTLDGDVLRIES